jgi:hypothetical protein
MKTTSAPKVRQRRPLWFRALHATTVAARIITEFVTVSVVGVTP